MCKEDFRLASKTKSVSRRVTFGVTSEEIAPYSPDRVAITISSHGTGRIWVSNRRSGENEHGLQIRPAGDAITFSWLDHPDWVRGPLFAVCPDGSIGTGIVETFLETKEYE